MLALPTGAQLAPPDSVSVRSVSGQFIVYGARKQPPAQIFFNDPNLLMLEPSLVAVSCERLKQALASEMGPGGQWRGKIHLALHPARSPNDEITLTGERFKDGWGYRLHVPNPVERTRFVRGVVQALLLEEANRQTEGRSAEIPVWLAEGLTRQVLASRGNEVLLSPSSVTVNRLTVAPTVVNARRADPLALARRDLREHAPLTWEQLSWPTDGQLDGAEGGIYRSSAQLFVRELLRLPDGRACLHALLEALPQFYNWQLAFLKAFQPHFQRPLDVEKWWALQVEYFTGRDARGQWSPEDSWAKLGEILRAPVHVRQEKKDLPSVADVPLTTVVREWDFARQTPILRAKLRELDGARLRMAAEYLPLVEDCRQTLTDYLAKRGQVGQVLSGGRTSAPGANTVVRETVKKLQALEAQWLELKPAASGATESVETSVE